MRPTSDTRRDSDVVAGLVAREKFLSRSIVSASFSLVEAFLSGLFFTAVHTKSLGSLACDEDFLNYAAKKESAPLKNRLDRVVQFASAGTESGSDEPFKTFIQVGKRYRDAIHHTTAFQRKDVESGGRLTALYEINSDIALHCVVLSSATLFKISQWTYGASDATDIATRCSELLEKAHRAWLANQAQRGAPPEPASPHHTDKDKTLSTRAHTVPKFYLRGFVALEAEGSRDPFVWIGSLTTGEITRRSPKNISIARGLYDGQGGFAESDVTIEAHLAKIESAASVAIRKFAATKIGEGGPIPPEITRFLAWQAARTPGWMEVGSSP
jgi:hypothetical protein